MYKHKTTEEMRKVAEEIRAYQAAYEHPEEWIIASIEHLYQLPGECYHVRYTDRYSLIFWREGGELVPALTWTYFAPDFAYRLTTEEEQP